MTEFVEVKTADLVSAALDWAVAQVEKVKTTYRYGRELVSDHDEGGIKLVLSIRPIYSPSTDWSQGGPLIEKYMRNSGVFCDGLWQHVGFYKCSFEDGGAVSIGHTPLIAACRAIVASVLGETVSVPKELV